MPYLGPRSFKTTPLTSSNLAYLNNRPLEPSSADSATPTKNTINQNMENSKGTNNTAKKSVYDRDSKMMSFPTATSIQNLPPLDEFIAIDQSPSKHTTNANKIAPLLHSRTASISDSCSTSAFSTASNASTVKSSETSLNSSVCSHKTMDLNEEDNKTIVLSSHSTNDPQLLIPPSPLKTYAVVSVSSNDSIADLNNNNNNNNNSPSQNPLLRKKSGELVKSSLRLPNLSRSNSMPNAKSVRFASRLENVKFFNKLEKPTAVSSRLSLKPKTHWDFDSSSDDDIVPEESENHDHDSANSNNLSNNFNDDYEFLNEVQTPKWLIQSNDCPYNPLSLNFGKLASNSNVMLESVKLNSSGNSLIGFVYAKNLAFKKDILVRLSYDHWNSFIDVENSNYISSNHIFKYSNSDQITYDKFSFIIKLDDLPVVSKNLTLEFCVQYVVNDTSYWDNNNGHNYRICLTKNMVNSDSTNKLKSVPISKSQSVSTSFDLEDTNIRLKDNNNFKYDFSNSASIPRTDMNSLRTSNSFGLKKIRSESSIPSMKFNILTEYAHLPSSTINAEIDDKNKASSSPIEKSSGVPTSTYTYSKEIPQLNKTATGSGSKSLSASPALSSTGFELSPRDFTDYDNIIKKFCFFSTSDDSNNSNTSINDTFNSYTKLNQSNYLLDNPAQRENIQNFKLQCL